MIFTSFLLDRCFFYLNSFPQKPILLRSTKYPEILYWQKVWFSLGTFDERKRYSLGTSKLWGVRLLFLRWVGTSTFFILCFFYCLGRLLLWDSKLIDWDWSMCPAQAGERYQAPLLTSAMGEKHMVGEKAKGWESMQVLSFEAQWSRKLQNTDWLKFSSHSIRVEEQGRWGGLSSYR